MARVYHVAPHGSDRADGTELAPWRTINHAAQVAMPGDTVMVHEGEYREWVRPARGGLSDRRRITYAAAPGEHAVIKGSERVLGWERVGGSVWRAEVDNELFGDFNPFDRAVDGDWIVYAPGAPQKHLGEVYLAGRSLYEVASAADVAEPARRAEAVDDWTGTAVPMPDPDATLRVWHADVGQDATVILANFQGADPNTEVVEINVRRSVFYPTAHHLDFITVRGFELAHAATPWAPPTADQPGLIGPNWAKGWVIEDNIIHDAKCVAVSIGKEASTGSNYATERGDKPGYQYQLESVFAARQVGWDREHVGSHIIRRNRIFDCGQAGIVGHLGCVFSTIEDNHIHAIGLKREFYGYEIAGIKLHAAIDVEIRHNRIHDCTLGTWLDWETQGTRVSRNLYYRNNRDLFVEVSHGPYLVDHNAFASPASLEVFSQGGAFVSNLVCGTVRIESVLDRATPYHVPHSTQVAGYAVVVGGDDRYIGNVFLGGRAEDAYAPGTKGHAGASFGTVGYDGHPATLEEYLARVDNHHLGDHERFHDVQQPVYARNNVYAGGARAFDGEEEPAVLIGAPARVAIVEQGEVVYLEAHLPDGFADARLGAVEACDLPRVRFTDAEYEERDGSPVVLDTDLVGEVRKPGQLYPPGPLASWTAGVTRARVW